MKKDIEWLKNEMRIRGRFPAENEYVVEQYRQIMELIDQLDEPQKPVIPKFVADYYKEYQNHELTFSKWFKSPPLNKGSRAETETFKWLLRNEHKTNLERQFILADIIAHGLDGYEVEEEKNYRVVFPYKGETVYLREGVHGDFDVIETETYGTQYTEAEIKAIDERYLAFKVPVEED